MDYLDLDLNEVLRNQALGLVSSFQKHRVCSKCVEVLWRHFIITDHTRERLLGMKDPFYRSSMLHSILHHYCRVSENRTKGLVLMRFLIEILESFDDEEEREVAGKIRLDLLQQNVPRKDLPPLKPTSESSSLKKEAKTAPAFPYSMSEAEAGYETSCSVVQESIDPSLGYKQTVVSSTGKLPPNVVVTGNRYYPKSDHEPAAKSEPNHDCPPLLIADDDGHNVATSKSASTRNKVIDHVPVSMIREFIVERDSKIVELLNQRDAKIMEQLTENISQIKRVDDNRVMGEVEESSKGDVKQLAEKLSKVEKQLSDNNTLLNQYLYYIIAIIVLSVCCILTAVYYR